MINYDIFAYLVLIWTTNGQLSYNKLHWITLDRFAAIRCIAPFCVLYSVICSAAKQWLFNNIYSTKMQASILAKYQPLGRKSRRLQASIQGVKGASCELVHTEKDWKRQRVYLNTRKSTHIRTKSDVWAYKDRGCAWKRRVNFRVN